MSAAESPRKPKIRRDGWTSARQIGFLAVLAEAKSVATAAASVGMSREGVYRLRSRSDGALFGALWDRVLQPDPGTSFKVHTGTLTDGRLTGLLGTHFRRKWGDYSAIGSPRQICRESDPTRTS